LGHCEHPTSHKRDRQHVLARIKHPYHHAQERCCPSQENGSPRTQEIYGLLTCDVARNDMIFDDILSALEAGRSPVVLTERKDHLQAIAERLTKFAKNIIVHAPPCGAAGISIKPLWAVCR
jgi:hypothetical protein